MRKNARQQWPGVFLCLALVLAGVVRADCPPPAALQWAELAAVVDGDTLRLADGRRLRLIAVNTPELAHRGHPEQPLAVQARRAVEDFFGAGARVGLLPGVDDRDRYGRLLARVYDRRGQSLAAHLLARGLGWHVTVPPNVDPDNCLRDAEQRARDAGAGVWGEAAYRPRESATLGPRDAGFAVITGTVRGVVATGSGWWLELPGISLRLSRADRRYFGAGVPERWLRRRIEVRGWIVDRSDSAAVKKHGYAPLMMQLRHPAMMTIDPAAPKNP